MVFGNDDSGGAGQFKLKYLKPDNEFYLVKSVRCAMIAPLILKLPLLCFFLGCWVTNGVEGEKSCYTPRQSHGRCVSIYECPLLLAHLKSRKVTNEMIEYLKKSRCGFEGIVPLVCCPLETTGNNLSIILFPSDADEDVDQCYTPQKTIGECVFLHECKPLLFLLKARNITQENVLFLKKSHCGFVGTIPKVCCPLTNIQIQPIVSENIKFSNLLPRTDVCGLSIADRMFIGEATYIEQYPWMVLIQYQNSDGERAFHCGGTLINNNYILTAAHCLKGKELLPSWKIISIRFGDHNIKTDPDCLETGYGTICAPQAIDMQVEEVIPHENYDPNDIYQYNDIGLIRLSQRVNYTEYIQPICLPLSSRLMYKNYLGKHLIVAGWGQMVNSSMGNIKKQSVVSVKNNSLCENIIYSTSAVLNDSQMCVENKKEGDPSRVDNGGTLMAINVEMGEVNLYAVGVLSHKNLMREVYTNVGNYSNWIVEKLRP